MQIKILYFSGCPNWERAAARVRTVLAEHDRADVAVKGEDVHQTSHLPSDWAGSPTVLLDGRDPFAAADGPPFAGLAIDSGRHPVLARDACRIYKTEAGFEGAPSLDQLRTALRRALTEPHNMKKELIAMSPTETETTVQDLARAIAAASDVLDEQSRRIATAIIDLLAQGDPITPAQIAGHARVSEEVVLATLKGWPGGVFWDDEGRVVGSWGLAIPEMAHKFQTDGGKPIYAWCALDPFLIVPVIGRPARVESKDPVTGQVITMTVTPQGIKDLSPATAVVSFLTPTKPFDFDVIQSFCEYVLNFASRESAERWAAEHEGIVLLPAAEAFEIGLRAWSKWHAPTSTERQATT